jgi:hypothetical protein
MDKGICRNERCRANGIETFVYLGDWFTADAVLCPFCGEAMDTVLVIKNGQGWRRDRPGLQGPLIASRAPRRWTR